MKRLLSDVAKGAVPVDEAFERLRSLPYENVGVARVDHHRAVRQGVPEVIFGEGKTAEQIVEIARSMRRAGSDVLVTRLDRKKLGTVRRKLRGSVAHETARCLVLRDGEPRVTGKGTVLVVPAGLPPEYLGGYLGPLRLLLSDLVVVTMAHSPAGLENLPTLRSHVERLRGDARLIVTDFEAVPLGDVRGRDVFFTTTAPEAVAARQVSRLEAVHGCRVVGWSARLADRAGLAQDMDGAEAYDVLLTELKAAAVDVACDRALAKGAEVAFVDNRALVVEGDADLPAALEETIELAERRYENRHGNR